MFQLYGPTIYLAHKAPSRTHAMFLILLLFELEYSYINKLN